MKYEISIESHSNEQYVVIIYNTNINPLPQTYVFKTRQSLLKALKSLIPSDKLIKE